MAISALVIRWEHFPLRLYSFQSKHGLLTMIHHLSVLSTADVVWVDTRRMIKIREHPEFTFGNNQAELIYQFLGVKLY